VVAMVENFVNSNQNDVYASKKQKQRKCKEVMVQRTSPMIKSNLHSFCYSTCHVLSQKFHFDYSRSWQTCGLITILNMVKVGNERVNKKLITNTQRNTLSGTQL